MLDLEPAVLSKVAADVISGVGIFVLAAWGACGLYLTLNKDKIDKQINNINQKKK